MAQYRALWYTTFNIIEIRFDNIICSDSNTQLGNNQDRENFKSQ